MNALFADHITRSYPPHLDPALANEMTVETEKDRDAITAGMIGTVGNDRTVYVLYVRTKGGAILYSEKFDASRESYARSIEFARKIAANRQGHLSLEDAT